MSIDLSIIIISWNVSKLLQDCLTSIEQYHGSLQVETIVIDSASSDDSTAMVEASFPDVTLLAQTENIGFVRGNNLGFENANGRHILLLNPDTRVHPHALQNMVAYLNNHPEVGVVGPHTLNGDGTHQSTRRRFPSFWTAIFESTWLQPFAPERLLNDFYVRDLPDDGTFEVDWVQGSALMARRDVYEKIGGFDTAYTMYFEEQDWCRRAKQAGWQIVYMGDTFITHYGGGSASQVSIRRHVHFQHSKLRYHRKFDGVVAALVLRAVLILNYAVQIPLEGIKGMLGSKPELRQDRIRAYWSVLKSLLWEGEQPYTT